MTSILQYVSIIDRLHGLRVIVLVCIMALFEVAGIASIMPLIGFLVQPEQIMNNENFLYLIAIFFDTELLSIRQTAIFLSTLSIIIFSLAILIRAYTNYRLNIFIEFTRHALSTQLMQKYLNVKYSYIIRNNSSIFTKAILSEVDQFIGQVFRPVVLMFAYTIVSIFVLGFLLILYWHLTLVVFIIFTVLYALVYLLLKNLLNNLGENVVQTNEQRFKVASEVTEGIKTIKITRSEKLFMQRFFQASKNFSRSQAAKQSTVLIPNDFVEFVIFGGTITGILLYVLIMPIGDSALMDNILGPLSVFALAAYRLKPAASNIFIGVSSMRFGEPIQNSIQRLSSSLEVNKSKEKNGSALEKFEKIELSKINFCYDDKELLVLQDQNVSLKRGEALGIIGESGSGKSTLVDILIGLLEPDTGDRLIDHKKVQGNDEEWRCLFGYVPQEIFVLDDDYFANVAFGVDRTRIDCSRVIEACKQAKLHDFILTSQAQGYKSKLGERGINLSGGQKQRLGIARALYFKPSVLILDEGTSALDPKIEDQLLSSLEELKGQLSLVMITHRSATLRICDNVIELIKHKQNHGNR